jgi:mannitol-1-phosphate 5-dehydrogenase
VKTAVQFGAGNIGRGFMGQLFQEAGYRTAFVDTNVPLVELISRNTRYTLKLLDAYSHREIDLVISGVEGIRFDDTAGVARRLAFAETAGTAVGVKNLVSIAPLLAAGIQERRRVNPTPLDIYLCENALDASRMLREATLELLDADLQEWANRNIGFVGTSVARMVPPPSDRFGHGDPLLVAADSYHALPFDAKATRAAPLPVEGVHGVADFRAEVERKLFTHNLGHAALAYLGHLRGCTYVHEPFADERSSRLFEGALDETSRALLARHAGVLDPAEHAEIRRDVRIRFGNPLLGDTVRRVARDPLRKLGAQDRMVGGIRLCLSQGVFPENVCRVCGAALLYDAADDPDAVRLQTLIADKGVEEALRLVSGIDPCSAEGRAIVVSYHALREGKE